MDEQYLYVDHVDPRRLSLTWLLIVVLVAAVSDPLGVFNGNFSRDSYTEIRSALSKSDNSTVLLVSSWDDFYSHEYNDYWRSEMGVGFVERNYGEVLDAASLGDDYFNQYLRARKITHILVPQSTFDQGTIRHKFTNRGSIEIKIGEPFFAVEGASSGPYASVLLKVLKTSNVVVSADAPKYEITWRNTDWWFYTKQTKLTEVGLYGYAYPSFYEWGPDVSWYFDRSPDRSNILELGYLTSSTDLSQITIELTLVSAYGPSAPEHEVLVSTGEYSEAKILSPQSPGIFRVTINTGETVKITNVSACRLPRSFEPTDMSNFEICYGVSKVLILPGT
jgi:hypothetical protein